MAHIQSIKMIGAYVLSIIEASNFTFIPTLKKITNNNNKKFGLDGTDSIFNHFTVGLYGKCTGHFFVKQVISFND